VKNVTARAREWLASAESALVAAQVLALAHPRSSVSRSYYSCYSAVHALAEQLVPKGVPPRGTFSHIGLPSVLNGLGSTAASRGVSALQSRLQEAYRSRLIADYQPVTRIDPDTVKQSIGHARSFVNYARKVVG
jgi:uncharacterized protein (UPF0332 family)